MAKIVDENALSAIVSDIKTALSGKANSNDVYPKSQTYNRTEIDNALDLKADKSELYNFYPTEQESGAIASFTDGADNIPVKSLVSEIVAVESGNGQPKSPTNPYSISGFDSGVVSVCGVNIWDEQWEVGSYDSSVQTVVQITDNTHIRSKNPIPVLPNKTYYTNSAGYNVHLIVADINGNVLYRTVSLNNGTFTTPANSAFVYFNMAQAYGTTYNNDISINYPSTDTQYHAYNGNTYTFTFGQTVYGGHFDNKGNLVVTYGMVDLGDLNWTKNGTYPEFRAGFSQNPTIPEGKWNGDTTLSNCVCSAYETRTPAQTYRGNTEGISISNGYIAVGDSNYADAPSFKSGVSGVYLVYEVVNPIILSITSLDIPTLLGENNIFSNTGDVEVDYHADIGLYIDKKISSLAQG